MNPNKIRAKALQKLSTEYPSIPSGFPVSVSFAAIDEALAPLVENGTLAREEPPHSKRKHYRKL